LVAWSLARFVFKRVSKCPNPLKQQEIIARNVFKKFDLDNSNTISVDEFQNLVEYLGESLTDSEINSAVKELDTDGSGIIECEEFLSWWTSKSSSKKAAGGISLKLKKLASRAM
jgi:Ca2+-binding EF-hand superfamily protein